jgi:hypothetical protein
MEPQLNALIDNGNGTYSYGTATFDLTNVRNADTQGEIAQALDILASASGFGAQNVMTGIQGKTIYYYDQLSDWNRATGLGEEAYSTTGGWTYTIRGSSQINNAIWINPTGGTAGNFLLGHYRQHDP